MFFVRVIHQINPAYPHQDGLGLVNGYIGCLCKQFRLNNTYIYCLVATSYRCMREDGTEVML